MSLSVAARDSSLKEKLSKILEKKNIGDLDYSLDFFLPQLPWNLPKMFPEFQRFHLELGCGWGEYSREWAAQHPDVLTIAVEKKRKRVFSTIKESRAAGLKNIRYLILDVEWFFEQLFIDNTFDFVTVNFPDPWPKAKHHKHRFMGEAFLQKLHSICRANCRLEFGSDSFEYANEVVHSIASTPGWQNIHGDGVLLPQIEGRPCSFFQQLQQELGFFTYFIQANCIK